MWPVLAPVLASCGVFSRTFSEAKRALAASTGAAATAIFCGLTFLLVFQSATSLSFLPLVWNPSLFSCCELACTRSLTLSCYILAKFRVIYARWRCLKPGISCDTSSTKTPLTPARCKINVAIDPKYTSSCCAFSFLGGCCMVNIQRFLFPLPFDIHRRQACTGELFFARKLVFVTRPPGGLDRIGPGTDVRGPGHVLRIFDERRMTAISWLGSLV